MEKLETYYCTQFGSSNVEVQAWVNPNTNEVSGWVGDFCGNQEHYCCDCEEQVSLLTLPDLWQRFSEVPVNKDDEIEENFLCFEKGTSKFDVWHWFDDRCPNNLHDDLMFNDNEED